MPVLILERFGVSKTLPKNETKIIEFRRSKAFTPATRPLTEGKNPTGSDFGYDQVSVAIQQYGDWAPITDVIQDTSKDMVLRDMSERQGEQIGETRELLMWDIVRAGTSVDWGGAKTSRVGVDKTAGLSHSNQRSATVNLDAMKAKMFTKVLAGSEDYDTYAVEPAYVACCHSDLKPTIRDLKGTNPNDVFVPVAKYGSHMKLVSPRELGSFEDVRYVTSPDLPPFAGAGATTETADVPSWRNTDVSSTKKYDVYPILYLGRDSFGCIVLRGMRDAQGKRVGSIPVRPAVLRPGVPRGGDQLGLTGSVGWSMYFACVILNDTWMRRVEVACPA